MASLVTSVRCVAPVMASLGEGPLWDPRSRRLLFLDIKGGKLFAYDPATEETASYDAPSMMSALGLRRSGGYVCAFRNGFARLLLDERGLAVDRIIDPESDRPANRFNDGKVDPAGGFWAGTMDDSQKDDQAGSWWRLAADGGVQRLDQGFHVTNGPAFDPSRGRVYFTDSARRVIYIATTDGAGLRGKEVFLTFSAADGYPDGMEVDKEGDLWVAFWDGAAVRRFSPRAERLEEVRLPVPRPTSIAFAGDRAYVTSARIGLSAEELAASPQSGGLFEVRLSEERSPAARYFEG